MYKLGLEKAEEPEIKFLTFLGLWRKQGNLKKKKQNNFCFFDFAKAFDCVGHSKLENS